MKFIYIKKKSIKNIKKICNILKIYVSGGGCMGIKYNFCSKKMYDDICIYNKNNLYIYTDIFSFFYIKGSELKLVKKNFNFNFVLHNDLIKLKCSCGISFKI
ncbi:hypothetical protein ACWNYO_00095 [Candidatus Vidania fulgoroideorum]